MGCGCFGVAAFLGFWGLAVGSGWWFLASLVLPSPIPSWGHAFWFAVAGAGVGMMLGAHLGSKNAIGDIGVPVTLSPRAREFAVDAASRTAAGGSFLGAMVGGFVWFLVAL